ncbi:hypothetical protein TTHERM_00825550 (macronuclear) [Tetrahymena thermophila SB210]|uniref:Uncharacterized protein n=1 Tax=Tetrahymena thermophila (strain SB210) TaxID=312017 RepID=I7MFA8_TETTS|nr:hypothetical protein TTHERM_00825550 [Tetrahymena thermophila SB210]EAR83760.2 hypothetical protein TTHERM_00825550 [Tetrahymena thermophila SB210]|eukprot:XP_001031423.2 hypothetical protein TTHERM_00825550 [Tetrahymena thermophila SB210]
MRLNHQQISTNIKENLKLNMFDTNLNQESRSKDVQSFKIPPRKQRKALSCNSKQWNNFFEAMRNMHEEQKKIRLSSQPQLRYQNIQKIMESNLHYKKLQRQLQQQAPEIDLEKNNLNQIVSNINNKGIVVATTTIKNVDHSIMSKSNRRFKSLESILNTIASRENGQDQIQNNQAKLQLQNSSNYSFSPDNNRFNSPTLLLQINQIQKNTNSSIDQQQELITKNNHKINNIPQSLVDIQSVNQSLIITQANSQPQLNNYSLQNIISDNQNNSPILSNRQEGKIHLKSKMSNNNSSNKEMQFTNQQTEGLISNQQKNLSNKVNFQKYQVFQSIKLQNTFENEQNNKKSLRLKMVNHNKSNSLANLTSIQQNTKQQLQEDSAFNQNSQFQLNQSKQTETLQLNNDTSTSTYAQQSVQTFRNQSKLSMRGKYQPISKPYQSSQSEIFGNIIKKMDLQKKQQEKQKEDSKLIKVMQKMESNESPLNFQQAHAISSFLLGSNNQSSPSIQQFTEQIDQHFSSTSPSSVIAMQKYSKILGDIDSKKQNLQDSLVEQIEQKQTQHNNIKINQDKVIEAQQEAQRMQFKRKIQRSNTQENMINLQNRYSKVSINQMFEQSHDFDTSFGFNSRKNQQQLQENIKQYQIVSEKNIKPAQREETTKLIWQKRKRSLNTFSDMLINQTQLSQIQLVNQSQFQQQLLQNQASSRYNYLDVKAETESIKHSLQLKKQKNLQAASLNKRKEFIDKIVTTKSNFHVSPTLNQNCMTIQTMKEDEVINMDKNVITKLQKLFQKQKPSTTDSPSRSPIKMCSPQNIIFQKESNGDFDLIINKPETGKNLNSSLREQTEENDTTNLTKQIKPLGAKSYSFSNRFSYKPQINQTNGFNPQERCQNQIDMIDQKQRSLSKLLHKKVITETCMPLRLNRNGISLTCRNHIHTLKNKQIPQNENNYNQKYQIFKGMSSLQTIPHDLNANTDLSIQLQKQQQQGSLTFNNQNDTDIIQIENLTNSNQ